MSAAASEVNAMGHGAAAAARKTVDELLDLFLGILLPIALFITAVMIAKQIGGYVTLGNFIWNSIGGGSAIANPITGPQTGGITGTIFLLMWGVPAIALLHASKSAAGKWGKFACRIIGAFFAGLAAFSAYFVVYSLQGGVASTLLGSGGYLDSIFATTAAMTKSATGTS
jgi:hypothetical protein